MKIFFYFKESNNTTYTHELLKYLAVKNNHEITDNPDIADITAISLTSFYDIDLLRIYRNRHPNDKIIVGGHVFGNPPTILRYADYVCLGHGFEFFRDCKNISDIENLYYIETKQKKGEKSEFIDWDLLPIVQIAKNTFSYFYSSGCRNKCKFCLTSWLFDYQVNPKKDIIGKIRGRIGRNKQLYLITNDFDANVNVGRKVSDVKLREYIKSPDKYKGIIKIRAGIESPDYEKRKFYGKPIKDDEIKEFLKLTKKYNKQVSLFFIAGMDEDEKYYQFMDNFENDLIGKPKIDVIVNYFGAQSKTPFQDYDMTKIIWNDLADIGYQWRLKNGRFVLHKAGMLKPFAPFFVALLERSHWSQVDDIMELKKKKWDDLDLFFEELDKKNLLKLAKGERINGC